jgi:hypothetical protein
LLDAEAYQTEADEELDDDQNTHEAEGASFAQSVEVDLFIMR